MLSGPYLLTRRCCSVSEALAAFVLASIVGLESGCGGSPPVGETKNSVAVAQSTPARVAANDLTRDSAALLVRSSADLARQVTSLNPFPINVNATKAINASLIFRRIVTREFLGSPKHDLDVAFSAGLFINALQHPEKTLAPTDRCPMNGRLFFIGLAGMHEVAMNQPQSH